MIIPKTIKVGKKLYTIHTPRMLQGYLRGMVNYRSSKLYVADACEYYPYKPKQKQETFWHEVTHAILYDMDNELYKNEKFVTEFSTRLNNAIRSAKF